MFIEAFIIDKKWKELFINGLMNTQNVAYPHNRI